MLLLDLTSKQTDRDLKKLQEKGIILGSTQMHWILIAFGLMGIIAGVLGKDFTVADVNSLAEFKPPKKSSTWSGKAVFIGVGAGLILIGIVIALR